jgi:predicted RNA-binding protein with PUA-like domain
VVEVIKTAYPDPTDPVWFAIDVVARDPLKRPVSLASIKADPALAELALVKSPRLSVQPVSEAHWQHVLAQT